MVWLVMCDPEQIFVPCLAPRLTDDGNTVTITDDPRAIPRRSGPDLYVMDVAPAVEFVQHCAAPAPIFLLTDREDGNVLREAVTVGATGVASTRATTGEILTALHRVATGRTYFDRDLLNAALRPQLDIDHAHARALAARLTAREADVLDRLVRGQSTRDMAESMGISATTVRSHVQNVMAKLNVHSRLAAAALALSHGLVDDPDHRTGQGA